MSSRSRFDELRSRLTAVELLALLKKRYDYKTLSELLDLPIPVLSRYVNGRVLPNTARSEKIISVFKEGYLSEVLKSKIAKTEEGFYDISSILRDISLQKVVGKVAYNEFNYIEVDKLLTVATDGIPIAVWVAGEFNAELVIAKKSRDMTFGDVIEQRLVRIPPIVEYLYIPKKAIKKGERILIVDDIIRTGKTIYCLAKLAEKAGGKIVGVFAVAMIDGVDAKLREELGLTCQIKALINLS